MRHIVILGNGISGITAAREIRKHSDDQITVISSETDHFYSRTALMYIYMGHLEYHHTKPYEDGFWKKNRIELVRAEVKSIDFDQKHLTLNPSVTEEGLSAPNAAGISYDILILAVGSKPNFFGWSGQTLAGVQGLYGIPDLERMEASTKGIKQAVVVGGGLIGIELCEMLLSRGIHVTFLVREKSFWNSVLPDEESALASRHIREHHVDLRIRTELKELLDDGSGRVRAIVTTADEEIPAQFVGIAVGVSPNINFLKDTPLETDRGILVNEYLETNLPDVYAIGDCVQHRTPPTGRKPLEQIWYTGRIMGEIVAQTILGNRTTYQPGVFFNSAKFFNIEYQTYGLAPAHLRDHSHLRTFYWEHADGRKAMRFYYKADDQVIVGVNTVGIRQRQEVWTRWITDRRTIQYVLEHLPQANFDPEFYKQHEAEILTNFNATNPGNTIRLKAKKGLFSWLSEQIS
ncbi:NAD(P)/FAD-dependent oxidoreductase [Fibrisoma limi]|nr:NAD(P)/FAD-dependent oxidoreductase [Fibrisoma limi]